MICLTLEMNNSRKVFKNRFEPKTTFKEISNFICSKLKLNFLETELKFTKKFEFKQMKMSETLRQNNIKSGDRLEVFLENTILEKNDFFEGN